jgi:hypothetical protein
VHADEAAFEATIALPAKLDRRFHRDARAGRTEHHLHSYPTEITLLTA